MIKSFAPMKALLFSRFLISGKIRGNVELNQNIELLCIEIHASLYRFNAIVDLMQLCKTASSTNLIQASDLNEIPRRQGETFRSGKFELFVLMTSNTFRSFWKRHLNKNLYLIYQCIFVL